MQVILAAMSMIISQMLVTKTKQVALSIQNYKIAKQTNGELVKQRIEQKKANILEKQKLQIKKESLLTSLQDLRNQAKERGDVAAEEAYNAQILATETEISDLKGSIKLDQVELNSLEQEALKLGVANNSTLNNISIGVASIGGGLLSAVTGSKA